MLDKTPEDSVKLWDLLDMELQDSLINERALLIGDAARPFLPRKIFRPNSFSSLDFPLFVDFEEVKKLTAGHLVH